MEEFFVWGQNIILPACLGSSKLATGATLAARRLHEPQPISNHPVGLGYPHPAGWYRRGDLRFRPPVFGVAEMWKDFQSGD